LPRSPSAGCGGGSSNGSQLPKTASGKPATLGVSSTGLGTILVKAIEREAPGERASTTVQRVAREYGEQIGSAERERRHLSPPGAERAMSVATEVLATCGYEPYTDEGCVRLRSCPFHALAEQSRDLVCGLNHELIQGIVSGLGNETLDVSLVPLPDECCVQLCPPSGARQSS